MCQITPLYLTCPNLKLNSSAKHNTTTINQAMVGFFPMYCFASWHAALPRPLPEVAWVRKERCRFPFWVVVWQAQVHS